MKALTLPFMLAVLVHSPALGQTALSGTPASIEIENVCPHTGGEAGCRQAATGSDVDASVPDVSSVSAPATARPDLRPSSWNP